MGARVLRRARAPAGVNFAAAQLAADSGPRDGLVSPAHLTAALLVEPYGVAATIFTEIGLSPEQVCAAVGAGPPAPPQQVSLPELREIEFTEGGKAALKGALRTALRLGHNYIGTEHLLLGLLHTGDSVREALGNRGLTPERAEELVAIRLAEILARRETGGA